LVFGLPEFFIKEPLGIGGTARRAETTTSLIQSSIE